MFSARLGERRQLMLAAGVVENMPHGPATHNEGIGDELPMATPMHGFGAHESDPLLRVLALNAGKVVTHSHLLREVWGTNAADQSQYLRVYMNHLRKKIEVPQSEQKLLKTESGVGYRLRLSEEK